MVRIDKTRAYKDLRRFIDRMRYGQNPITPASLNTFGKEGHAASPDEGTSKKSLGSKPMPNSRLRCRTQF